MYNLPNLHQLFPSFMVKASSTLPLLLLFLIAFSNPHPTYADAIPPVITCPADITVNTDPGQPDAIVGLTATATDNNPGVTVSSSPPGNIFPIGATTVTATATDGDGDSSSFCTFIVTIIDVEPPNVACPGNQALNTNINGQASLPGYASLITATDNSGLTPVIVQTPVTATLIGEGVTLVTVTATDTSGNSASCSFNVTASKPAATSIPVFSNWVIVVLALFMLLLFQPHHKKDQKR